MNPQNMFRKPRWEFTMFLFLIPFVLSQNDEEVIGIPLNYPEVQDNIDIVKRCPGDEAEWLTAEKRKNCSKTTKDRTEELVYHCVPNHYQNVTVEVCVPMRLIVFGYCVEYSFLGRKVQENYNTDCTQFAVPCPTFYKSNEVYKYQGCYNAFKSTVQHPWNRYKERIDRNSLDVPKSKKKADEKPEKSLTLIFMFGLSLPCIVMFLVCVWTLRNDIKNRCRPRSKTTKSTESEKRKLYPSWKFEDKLYPPQVEKETFIETAKT